MESPYGKWNKSPDLGHTEFTMSQGGFSMVKGITRQVVVVKGPDQKLFDQAIFLVREDALASGGVTEEALLNEAKIVCKSTLPKQKWMQRLLWAGYGAFATGVCWLLFAFVI